MNTAMREDAQKIMDKAIQTVLPDAAGVLEEADPHALSIEAAMASPATAATVFFSVLFIVFPPF